MANQYTNTTPEQRFWKSIRIIQGRACWEWTGTKDKDGYGKLSIGGRGASRGVRAHRFSYELHIGPIPDDLLVLHDCDNPQCCNPKHLKVGTQAENRADMVVRGGQPRGEAHWMKRNPEKILRGDDSFSRKHPERLARGERAGLAKLTTEQVRLIRKRHEVRELSIVKLAKEYGVSKTTIEGVIYRKTWRHVI